MSYIWYGEAVMRLGGVSYLGHVSNQQQSKSQE
jgi:hypothetical protein